MNDETVVTKLQRQVELKPNDDMKVTRHPVLFKAALRTRWLTALNHNTVASVCGIYHHCTLLDQCLLYHDMFLK